MMVSKVKPVEGKNGIHCNVKVWYYFQAIPVRNVVLNVPPVMKTWPKYETTNISPGVLM